MKSKRDSRPDDESNTSDLKGWHYALLLLPYIGLLIPAMYSRRSPELFGFPFFYWYQFIWVFISAMLTGIVYWRTRR